MHCEYCGKEIGEARFCRYCGKKVAPLPDIRPWRQSVVFSALGIILSVLEMLLLILNEYAASLYLLLRAPITIYWFMFSMPQRLQRSRADYKHAIRKRIDYVPKTRAISFLNCWLAGVFGLMVTKSFECRSLDTKLRY